MKCYMLIKHTSILFPWILCNINTFHKTVCMGQADVHKVTMKSKIGKRKPILAASHEKCDFSNSNLALKIDIGCKNVIYQLMF